jgi:chlorophyll synthase
MERPSLPAFFELLKPITWFAPMWAFGCGVVSAGVALGDRWLTAMSQAVNDWFDRHVDAINEPDRPIPSGRIPGNWGLYIAIAWTVLSLLVAAMLGPWVLGAALIGTILAWLYSAPPIRLKQSGWWGPGAVGLSYEGLPWFTGAAVMVAGFPDWRIVTLAVLYSIGAHGIMTLNDFKAVEGDRQMGIRSLPATLGVDAAARLACWVMAVPQGIVIVLLVAWERPYHAGIVFLLLAAQAALMVRLLQAPRERAPWYNATGTTLYVLGMLASAFAVRALAGAET